ncbi:MAG TPA: SMC-Scp complex subunit ScpB [Lysobacter sp.]|nr:SMC-Scp complex subunit ScpB [Lysobacter sp.]
MDQTLINRIVEAALLASSQPLSLAQLRELFPEDEPAPPGALESAIEALQAACAERGVELVEVATGFRYQVRAEVHGWVTRLWTERQTRYTRATLETLALIAYRQPITRGEIEQVRGVSVSSNIIKALEEREWIRVVGHRDVPGRPALFGTTKGFLDYFGLKRLDELPPLSELKDIGELEPQLQFEEATGVAPALAVGNVDAGDVADVAARTVDAQDEQEHRDDPQEEEDEDGDDLDFRTERPVVFMDDGLDDTDDDETPDGANAAVDPEAAPGERAADENDHEQDNAVETTTVPDMTTASSDAAESNENE